MGQGRQSGFSGPQALSAGEISAWADLTGTVILPEEYAIIREMDGAYLSAAAEEAKAIQARRESKPSKR